MTLVERVTPAMGTAVTIRILTDDVAAAEQGIDRALAWFAHVEARCSRFDAASDLARVNAAGGAAVVVDPLLYRLLEFALEVAAASDGAFDPTVGGRLHARGDDVEWRSGMRLPAAGPFDPDATFRDVALDPVAGSVQLLRPLALDLGAVAKGLAVDVAARELAGFRDYAIDAGGDLYCAGHPEPGLAWTIGLRHPRDRDRLLTRVAVEDAAVCTSGDYERRLADGASHLVDPRARRPADGIASATVVAPQAMLADALSTAAAVMPVAEAIAFLEAQGVHGYLVTTALDVHTTAGWRDLGPLA